MGKSSRTMAEQVALAASDFHRQCTGHVPTSVPTVLSEDTLVVTLHDALTPAEKALARSPAGAAQVREFHRQLFANSAAELRQEIERIIGVEIREATAEIETTTGTMVQVFLLAQSVSAETWNGSGSGNQSRKRRFSHVGLVTKSSGIGRGRRGRWLPADAQSHGA